VALSLGDLKMKKASEYRQHAVECRQLAAGVQGTQREQLLEMANTWDKLATERAELVSRHPELAMDGEHPPQGQTSPAKPL
jgi:hypothetical protein